ncbi:MAG: hypothetical protein ACRDHY_02730, partial [Anaerolineales bacterium]
MSTWPEDRELRELFAETRVEDFGRTPPFARVRRGRAPRPLAPRRVGLRMALAGGVLVLLVAVGALTVLRGHREPDAEALALAHQVWAWRSPTDFLLDTPGAEYLRTIPDIG